VGHLPRAFSAIFSNVELAHGRPCPRDQWCLHAAGRPHWLWSHFGPLMYLPDGPGQTEPIEVMYACEACLEEIATVYDDLFTRVERGRRHLWRRRQ
jgi:hypothetical protein